ncbi:MAG: hypothetical protein HYZ15_01815 [Sphingobacteriales bacterium]|nr:hypothetical protein [Sphingobacteriales bacterium]
MPERESTSSSLLLLFFVTGLSCFGFSLFIKMLDGNHSDLLIWTGCIASSLGLLTLLAVWISRLAAKKKKPHLADKGKN